MSLEDHAGDIVSKARNSARVSIADAARAAGIGEPEYAALEDSGRPVGQVNWRALGTLLGLDSGRLEKIANGWTPEPQDLTRWREVRQISTRDERMAVNCYLVWDEATLDAAIFDTGFDARAIFRFVDEFRLEPKHLFLTHTHYDHISALGDIRERFPKIKLHSNSKNAPVEQRNRPNDFIHLGNLRISNRDTPGHADDGVTYIVGNFPEDAPSIAIVGDAIFAGSMGGARDQADLAKRKIREQILSLPLDTLICPGHGPLTTVGQERENNPFFGKAES